MTAPRRDQDQPSPAMSPAALLVSLPIRAYRLVLSPWVGMHCRFHPTCSAYALEALAKHGAFRGSLLAARRIARCNPWGGAGLDPVPERRPKGSQSTRSKKMMTSPRSTPKRET